MRNILIFFLVSINLFSSVYFLYRNPLRFNSYVKGNYEILVEQIPTDERNSFVAYNCPTALYLQCDITPGFKYFIHQDWQASYGKSIEQRIITDFEKNKTKWLLLHVNAEKEPIIQDIIERSYVDIIKTEDGEYCLYKLNEKF